jgi:hypothetical protein
MEAILRLSRPFQKSLLFLLAATLAGGILGCPGKERGDDTVARVNGEKIILYEVDKY